MGGAEHSDRRASRYGFAQVLRVLFAVSLVLHLLDLSFVRPQADGRENLVTAHNLVGHHVYGAEHREGKQKSDNWREPLQPMLLAAALILHPTLSGSDADYECILGSTRPCQEKVAYLKLPSILLGHLAALLMAIVVHRASRRRWVGWLTFVAISFAGPLAHEMDRFYSEGLAAFLLTVLSLAPMLGGKRVSRRWVRFGIAGLALALLILTKAVFLYFVPLFVVVVAFSEWQRTRRVRRSLPSVLAVVLPIAFLVGGWKMRNWVVLDTTSLTQRSGLVLYMRAAMNDTLAKHRPIAAGLYAGGRWRAWAKRTAPKRVLEMLDDHHPRNFRKLAYNRWDKLIAKKGQLEGDRALRAEAIAKIEKHPENHLWMTGPVLVRGLSQNPGYGFGNMRGQSDKLGAKYLGINLTGRLMAPYYLPWILFVCLFACFPLGLSRRRRWLLWLALPSCFATAIYAAASHFIPRYAVPSIPAAHGAFVACSVLLAPRFMPILDRALRRARSRWVARRDQRPSA